MIILDTNVVSELMRPEPDSNVQTWVMSQKVINLSVTAITIAEIQRGLKRLPGGKRRNRLESHFMAFITAGFEGRILAFDEPAASIYGELAVKRESKGFHVDAVDLMIAAIAKNTNAAIATRNTGDFEGCGIKIINPWN